MTMTAQMSDVSRYFNDDTVFNAINRNFVSLSYNEVTEINVHLLKVVYELLANMKQEDSFFKQVFQRIVYSGSYYKKTKTCSPDEFDLNMVIKLPINYNLLKIEPCLAGFVKIHSGLMLCDIDINNPIDKALMKLLDLDMYFNQEKLLRWMESIFDRTIKKLPVADGNKHLLATNTMLYVISTKKTGPAFTLHIEIPDNKELSVDLVPVLELSHKVPNMLYNLKYFQKETWYAVPKPLDKFQYKGNKKLCWRTCFYEQEKEILSRNGKMKPVLRHLKKLRDTQKWKHMSSYYLETLVLHVLQEYKSLERKSYTSLFMMMLEKLHMALEKQYIPYYWDETFNLLDRLKLEEIKNMEGRLRNIITCIHRNIRTDSFIIARYMLNEDELNILMTQPNMEDLESELSENNATPSNAWKCIIL